MSSRLKYRHNKDKDQGQYEKALKSLNIPYVDLSMRGEGCPDLLVSHNRENILFEIKTGSAKLTEAEAVFHAHWKGPLYVIREVNDMLHHLGFQVIRDCQRCGFRGKEK